MNAQYKKYLVYGLVDPRTDEIRYVGKSCSGLSRVKRHIRPYDLANDKTWKGRWLKRLLESGLSPKAVILEEFVSDQFLSDAERYWIAQGRGLAWPLTNLTEGGEGLSGYRVSEDTRQKMSERARTRSAQTREKLRQAAKERWAVPEFRARAIAAMKDKWADPQFRDSLPKREVSFEARKKISLANAGRIRTPETRQRMSVAQTGRVHTEESRRKRSVATKGKKPSAIAYANRAASLRRQEVRSRIAQKMEEIRRENPSRGKLTPEIVRVLRSLEGVISERALAKRFCVSPSMVNLVLNGKRWGHVK